MSKRFSTTTRRRLLEAVIRRDGDRCLLCRKTDFRPKERSLDHLNNNIRDNRLENLHLLCRGCNTAENNRLRAGNPRLLTAETLPTLLARLRQRAAPGSQVPFVCVRVCEDVNAAPSAPLEQGTPAPFQPAPYRGAETPIEASRAMRPAYWLWLFRKVKEHGGIREAEAVNAGAAYLAMTLDKGSPETVKRYFAMATSSAGWLVECRDEGGHSIWRFPPGADLSGLQRTLERQAEAATGP